MVRAVTDSNTSTVERELTVRLTRAHREELIKGSSIDPQVIMERGYVTVGRPSAALRDAKGRDTRQQLLDMGFPKWAVGEDWNYPALLIPMYSPRGERLPGQVKPFSPVLAPNGRRMKYASAKSPSRLDVHPRWTRDPDPEGRAIALPAIQDVDIPLWITEGVKKADSLTSRGICTVALAGVYNWRNTHATLGDWEDVRLRGREIVVCFDADTITKPPIQRAMARLGAWLRHKGARKIWYLVVPPAVDGQAVKGVDDFFAAGGTVAELERAFRDRPPRDTNTADQYTDARMAETLAAEVLDGRYIWVPGGDWHLWDGTRWREVHEAAVLDDVRRWALDQFADAADRLRQGEEGATADVDGWRGFLSANRQRAVLALARGIVMHDMSAMDADGHLLNTPGGVVDLRTGEVMPHDPDLYMTKITKGSYRPGHTHPDWEQALQALPEDVREWWQVRMGQALTGERGGGDGRLLVLQGGGSNGKSALTTDGLLHAVGDYGMVASQKLLMGARHEHSTEIADLQGRRLVVIEELIEDGQVNVGTLKRIADVSTIRARRAHKDNIEFPATHTLVATTNPIPVVRETDDGTWRRLTLIRCPYRWVPPGKPLAPGDRVGDPTLKQRLIESPDGQHDAMITWAVEGARRWYANREALVTKTPNVADIMLPPERVERDTQRWRALSDRILGFWLECLVPDPTAAVWAPELLEHFNAWLRENGHSPWAKETFGPRFESHEVTTRHGVVRQRTRNLSGIVRRSAALRWSVGERELPKQPEVWRGVRFRLPADDE